MERAIGASTDVLALLHFKTNLSGEAQPPEEKEIA
jgi:hypothetical protein